MTKSDMSRVKAAIKECGETFVENLREPEMLDAVFVEIDGEFEGEICEDESLSEKAVREISLLRCDRTKLEAREDLRIVQLEALQNLALVIINLLEAAENIENATGFDNEHTIFENIRSMIKDVETIKKSCLEEFLSVEKVGRMEDDLKGKGE